MAGQGSAEDAPQGYAARWSWSLPAVTFLAGCALGGTLVAVGTSDDGGAGGDPTTAAADVADDAPADPDDSASDGGAADGEAGLYVRVPDSCVRTATDATTLVEHVDRVVAAVAELEPERLRQTVDDLQQLRDPVQDAAEQCRQEAASRVQDAASAAETPAP